MKTETSVSIYWSVISFENWRLHLAATDQGLAFVGSDQESFQELEAWANTRFAKPAFIEDDRKLEPYAVELIAYLQGKLQHFSMPVYYKGTPFQEAVWQALISIPYGQTCSYSDIAQAIDKPAAVRAVGAAIGANPVMIMIPCHRVIGKNGKLTGFRGGLAMKTRLLELEQQPIASSNGAAR